MAVIDTGRLDAGFAALTRRYQTRRIQRDEADGGLPRQ
jgi:hypothetical protein